MSKAIYFRIFGNGMAVALHGINSLVMLAALQNEIVERDPELKTLVEMQSRFITIWNVALQLLYGSLSLTCDILTLVNKEHLLPKSLGNLRHTIFTALVFPATIFIFCFFWPVYLYDRNLIFPEFIDKLFSQKSNYVMHISILPIVFWDILFQPRPEPKSHKKNLQILGLYYIIYNGFIFITYAQTGLWPYPLLGMLYGTVLFPLFFLGIIVILLLAYYGQWKLSAKIWGLQEQTSKVK